MPNNIHARYAPDGTQILDGNDFPFKQAFILAKSAVPMSVTGTVAETTLATIQLPGGRLGDNGQLRIHTLWSVTNNANNKQLRTRLAGAQLTSLGVTAVLSVNHEQLVANRGGPVAQVTVFNAANPYGSSTSAVQTFAIDTSVDQIITLTGQLANTGDTITLEAYLVEIFPTT